MKIQSLRNKYQFQFSRLIHDLKHVHEDPEISQAIFRHGEFTDITAYLEEIEQINAEELKFARKMRNEKVLMINEKETTGIKQKNESTEKELLEEVLLNIQYKNMTFLYKIDLIFEPQIGPYKNYKIPVHLLFCSKYPLHPPYIFTPLFHPSVYQTRMCLLRETWTSDCTLQEILYQIKIALDEPVFDLDSFNELVSKTWENSQKEAEKYDLKEDHVNEFHIRVQHSLSYKYFYR